MNQFCPGRSLWALLLAAALFLIPAILIARQIGLEADEALVTAAIFDGLSPHYSITWGSRELPLMLLSYVGTLRAWMYNLIFLAVPPSALALRLPMILAGLASLWLLWRIAGQVGGREAACASVLLLATDPVWMLSQSIDFGYVALQNVLKLGGLWLAIRYASSGRTRHLAAAGFLWGLALWDKAVFVWVLAGLVVAAVVAAPGGMRRIPPRAALLALAGLAAGAAPFLFFNIVRPLETFRSNARVGGDEWMQKVRVLEQTLDGSVLFGVYTAADAGAGFRPPHRPLHHAAYAVSAALGEPRRQAMLLASVLLLLAAPWWWRGTMRQPILFAITFFAVTWLAMAMSRGAGGAAHHAILCWPAHTAAIAFAGADLARRGRWSRRIAAAALALLVLANLAVVNQYYVEAVRQGSGLRHSDAIEPLYRKLVRTPARTIAVADWGIAETLLLLSEGRLPVRYAWSAGGAESLPRWLVSSPDTLFVGRPPGQQFFPEHARAVEEAARAAGKVRYDLETILDRNGRPAFELFRYGPPR